MKKLIAIVCIAATLFLLCACSDNTPVEGKENGASEGELIASGEFFDVTKLTDSDGNTKYEYEIRSRGGEVLESALCAEQPRIAQINENLIGMRFTSGDHVFSRYYDIKNGKVSESIMNAFWDNGELVASNSYDNGHYFVVQTIFGDAYYSRTDVECISWQITVIAAELNEDETVLTVSYIHGDGSDTKAEINTVELPLVEEEADAPAA